MNKLVEVLKLTRIEHSIMLVIAVIAGELLAGGLPGAVPFILSMISPIFISMGSFAINDYYDIKVDKLNRKNRPLVSGSLKPTEALYITQATFVIGIAASAFINFYAFVIALFFAGLAVFYSYELKESFLLGNIYIALTMVIPFIYGNFVVGTKLMVSVVLVCAMVFLSGLGREIHGTVRDFRGDVKMRKAKTLPRVVGMRSAVLIALVLYLAAVVLSIFLFLYIAPFRSSMVYGALVAVADALLLYVAVGYAYTHSQQFYEETRNVSLFAMGLALIAIMLSALVHI